MQKVHRGASDKSLKWTWIEKIRGKCVAACSVLVPISSILLGFPVCCLSSQSIALDFRDLLRNSCIQLKRNAWMTFYSRVRIVLPIWPEFGPLKNVCSKLCHLLSPYSRCLQQSASTQSCATRPTDLEVVPRLSLIRSFLEQPHHTPNSTKIT